MGDDKKITDTTVGKSIDNTINALNRVFGKGAVFQLGDKSHTGLVRDRISSGSLTYDKALGGGFVKGTLHELYGKESSGKTTACLHAIAAAQKHGAVLFIDAEYAFDPVYAKALGVDINTLYFHQPDTAEQAFEVVEAFAHTAGIAMIVVDSIAALTPRAEAMGDSGDSNMGLMARLSHQHLRKVTGPISNSKIVYLFTNHITYKMDGYGNPEVTAGGTGWKHHSSTRTKFQQVSSQKNSQADETIKCKATVAKNKTYIPLQVAEFDIDFGTGINRGAEIFDIGLAAGVLEKSGSWYSIGDERIGQGRKNCSRIIADTLEYQQRILTAVYPEQEDLCTSQTPKETSLGSEPKGVSE